MKSRFSRDLRLAPVVTAIMAAALLTPAAAQAPSLAMLGTLTPGQWELRFRDGSRSQRICVRSGQELVQVRHGGTGCNRFVVEDGAGAVTVQYTCRGNGYGRTSIRRETTRLVQIESQGIAGGLPFEFAAEGRHVGACN